MVNYLFLSTKVTLSTKDIVKSDRFKGSIYWNSCHAIHAKAMNHGRNIYKLLSASLQGVKKLFVLAYAIAACATYNGSDIKDRKKYFGRKRKIQNYDVLIDGKKNNLRLNSQWLNKTVWWNKKIMNRTRWWLYCMMFFRLCIFKE